MRVVPAIAIVALVAIAAIDPTLGPAALTVVILVPAAIVDLHERRIPDRMVFAALFVLLASAAVASTTGAAVGVRGLAAGAVLMGGPILALHLVSPAAMGFGDVKASIVLGAGLGTVDWRLGLLAVSVAAAAGALVGLGRRVQTIAFGPFLVFGSFVALAAAASGAASSLIGTSQ